MTNPMGIAHGGIFAAIIDDAIGWAVFSFGEDQFYSTINNIIDYFRPVPEGATVTASTMIIKKGENLINAECEITYNYR